MKRLSSAGNVRINNRSHSEFNALCPHYVIGVSYAIVAACNLLTAIVKYQVANNTLRPLPPSLPLRQRLSNGRSRAAYANAFTGARFHPDADHTARRKAGGARNRHRSGAWIQLENTGRFY